MNLNHLGVYQEEIHLIINFLLDIMMKGNTPATNITSSGTKGQQTYNRAISNIERKNKMRQKSQKIRQVLRNY